MKILLALWIGSNALVVLTLSAGNYILEKRRKN